MITERPSINRSRRVFDVILSGLGLVLLAPVMLLAAALIKLSSRGPVLYAAQRAGHKGRPFRLLKFRTMHVGADRQGAFTAKSDPRVFPLGWLLRVSKLDELPQLINVLRGEMSIVGPRPEDIEIVREHYTAEQREVLEVLPGLTGLPQVRFFPEMSQIDPGGMDPQAHYRNVILPLRLEMDLRYVRTRTLWLDLYLILATVFLITFKAGYTLIAGQKTRPLPEAESTWR